MNKYILSFYVLRIRGHIIIIKKLFNIYLIKLYYEYFVKIGICRFGALETKSVNNFFLNNKWNKSLFRPNNKTEQHPHIANKNHYTTVGLTGQSTRRTLSSKWLIYPYYHKMGSTALRSETMITETSNRSLAPTMAHLLVWTVKPDNRERLSVSDNDKFLMKVGSRTYIRTPSPITSDFWADSPNSSFKFSDTTPTFYKAKE